jgi:hypothetical protein
MGQPPVLASSNRISTLLQRFACARLSQSYLPESRSDFSSCQIGQICLVMDSNRVIRADDPWLAQSAGTPNFNVSGAIKDFRHDAGLWVELGDSQGPSPSGTPTTTNVSQGKHLPPSWTTLYELTKLDDDTFDQKLHDGTINPEMQRKDVARQNRILSRERDRRRVENLAPIWGTAKRGEHLAPSPRAARCRNLQIRIGASRIRFRSSGASRPTCRFALRSHALDAHRYPPKRGWKPNDWNIADGHR